MYETHNTQPSISAHVVQRYIYQVVGFIALFLMSQTAFAEAPPSCPSGHQMYYIDANTPAGAHTPTNLSWTTGSTNKTFEFNDGVQFRLSFSEIANLRSGYPSFSSYSNVTQNAINMLHTSEKRAVNHKITGTILNSAVSKYGFVVQDLDTNERGRYVESLTIGTANGSFLNLRNNYFRLSNNNQTVSGVEWNNCGTSNSCDFNVNWSKSGNTSFSANQPFVVTHGNVANNAYTNSSDGDHLVGYSDFYFCVAPPVVTTFKLTVIKKLNGARENNEDQFHIAVKDRNANELGNFITEGSGDAITAGKDRVSNLTINQNISYKITEQVRKNTISGALKDIRRYDATYQCTVGSGSNVAVSGTLDYSSTENSRSFTLPESAITSDLTCTITNTKAKDFVFSGTVFNDNGGLPVDSTNHMASNQYFNGVFEPGSGETGIGITGSGLAIRLYDCASGNSITEESNSSGPLGSKVITPVYDSKYAGHFSFTVPKSGIENISSVCVQQVEPTSGWNYVDTTDDVISGIQINKEAIFSYINLDFGEVLPQNTALVLSKQQYAHDCSEFDYLYIKDNAANPSLGFSKERADVEPGACIAYKITAINRGNKQLKDIVISDTLQKAGQNGATVTSTLANPITTAEGYATNRAVGYNGTIKTASFNLASKSSRSFYFNTKYGE